MESETGFHQVLKSTCTGTKLMFMIIIMYFIVNLVLLLQCLKQEQERNKKLPIVKHESLSFALTEGIKIVSTVVFPEGQYSEDLEVELKSWKATHLVRQKNWELRASITEVNL